LNVLEGALKIVDPYSARNKNQQKYFHNFLNEALSWNSKRKERLIVWR